MLEAILQGRAPKSLRGVMGFAGWEPSQLEREIARGSWLPISAEASLVFDVSLEDSDLLGEVELTTNLIIAASETDDHLSDAEIDEILGVVPQAPG